MITENSIRIRGTKDDVLRWVSRVEKWPDFFPHYRWVRVHEQGSESLVATMAAKHLGLPLRWTSVLECKGGSWPEPLATFRHIRGVTRGMEVAWLVKPLEEGVVEVSIQHVLKWPRGGRWIAQRIVGDVFVKGVASKTLGLVKRYVESKRFP